MTWFAAQNGWLQFAFGNSQDTYTLPGLIDVGWERYLLYCLKRAGYEAVYFWGRVQDGKYTLTNRDEASASYYDKICPKSFLEKLLGSSESIQTDTSVSLTPEKMEKLVYNILDSKQPTALVVSIGLFCDHFIYPVRCEELKRHVEQYGSRKNLILLTGSVMAEDNGDYLVKPDGVLATLLREVRDAAAPEGSRHLYEKLKDNLDARCIYLNELNHEGIRSIVLKHALLRGRGQMPADAETIDKTAWMIDWYYHSEEFRAAETDLLPENRKREYQVIDRWLQNQRRCDAILSWLKQHTDGMSAETFCARMKERFPREDDVCRICTDSFMIKKWDQLSLPVDAKKAERLYPDKITVRQRMMECRKTLLRLVLRGAEIAGAQELDACIDQMRETLSEKDMSTFSHALKAMEYLLDAADEVMMTSRSSSGSGGPDDESGERAQMRKKVWEFYTMIFNLSENIRNVGTEIAQYDEQIRTLNGQLPRMFARLHELEQDPVAEENGDINILKQRLIQCDDDINLATTLRKMRANQRYQYTKTIHSLEQSIQALRNAQVGKIKGIMEEAMATQQRALEDIAEETRELQEIKKKDPYAIERLTGQSLMDSKDVEERYAALELRLNELYPD